MSGTATIIQARITDHLSSSIAGPTNPGFPVSVPDCPSGTAPLSAPYLHVLLSFGAANFNFADTAEKALAGFVKERAFLKTADGI